MWRHFISAIFSARVQGLSLIHILERLSSDADEMESILLVRAATGNLPDIWMNSVGAKLDAMSPKENCYDLSGEDWITERVNGDYLNIVTDEGAGEIYGIPCSPSNVAGVFYNKKVYEELGLEIPNTWEEFMENCRVCLLYTSYIILFYRIVI